MSKEKINKNIIKFIEDAAEDYEVRGDNGDYIPTKYEKFMLKDFVFGLLENTDFIELCKTNTR